MENVNDRGQNKSCSEGSSQSSSNSDVQAGTNGQDSKPSVPAQPNDGQPNPRGEKP